MHTELGQNSHIIPQLSEKTWGRQMLGEAQAHSELQHHTLHIPEYTHTCIRAHAYIQTYTHTCIRAHIHTYKHVYAVIYLNAYLHT